MRLVFRLWSGSSEACCSSRRRWLLAGAVATLADLRLSRFLTQKQLAERLGVPYQMVQRWETGYARPQPRNLAKLAEALDVGGEELLAALRDVGTECLGPIKHLSPREERMLE